MSLTRFPIENRALLEWTIAVFLFVYGLVSFPLAVLGPDRAMVPGDLGDARFNNYILEHFHQYVTGNVDAYWDAPFMYPRSNVIAHSDNLLGTAPVYTAFRFAGFNRESAFQLWILAMFTLNFWCCFLALQAWSRRTVIAACAAFIFAFGIYNIGQMDHAQVFPRFLVPIAFLFMWRSLSHGKPRDLFIVMITTVGQFYCGIYLGFFLLYSLFFLTLGYAITNWQEVISRLRAKKTAFVLLGALLLGALLLAPLMLPYIKVSNSLGTREFHEVVSSIPRPSSYFFTHPAALSWRDLSEHSKFAFDIWWDHFLFIGILPWITLAIAFVILLSKKGTIEERRSLAALSIALILSTLFILNLESHTLYHLFYSLPGFSALRALGRSINVQVMFFLFLFVAVLSLLPRTGWKYYSMVVALPLLVVLDNRIDTTWMKSFDKWAARNKVNEVARQITHEMGNDARPIAYIPVLPAIEKELEHDRLIETNITAMLAAQQIGVPIVNGYSGSYPPGYMYFFDHMDERSLGQWCEQAGCDLGSIRSVTNIPLEFEAVHTVGLKAANGLFLCANTKREELVVADRPAPLLWETYRLICLGNDRIVLLAHNDKFVCAETMQRSQVSATAPYLGDLGIFTTIDLDDGWIALKAHNDRFISLDQETFLLHATADSIGANERFLIAPIDGSDIISCYSGSDNPSSRRSPK